eukprot:CAMPEP_0203637272 /NCGR_PEP_ID=MMETSP0088-20131115/3632_1 /ASSEMBLY_ACC=CAM_ASM_001087 /TAXON_ID=426623 /ORGANISM="Chaetoceros affinis, Strain CCMP159" /LENGTH=273 /DNA_ID=CAMNT_0050491653 /DNA_START=202 /DNA_END=1023 /DNA_ORIENTATION=-
MMALYFLLLIPGSYLTPAEQFCPEDKGPYTKEQPCRRPTLFAFEGVCSSIFFLLSTLSIQSWYVHKEPSTKLPPNPIGRVYGYLPRSEQIAAISFTFQLWSVVTTPFIPEFYSSIMMGHHILATITSYLALQYQTYHYYIMVFLALSEVSSLPLVIMGMAKYYPSHFGFMKAVAEPLFVVLFVYYRVIVWNRVSWLLWKDSLAVLKVKDGKSNDGKKVNIASEYRPGKAFVLYVILTIDVILGLLQLFWFTKIMVELLMVLGIDVIDFNPGFE